MSYLKSLKTLKKGAAGVMLAMLVAWTIAPILKAEEGAVTGSTASGTAAETASTTESAVAPAGETSATDNSEAGIGAGNLATGADSSNSASTEISNTQSVININTATTTNDSYLKADTGRNTASYNTGSGIITTEKARGKGEIVNTINLNMVIPEIAGIGPISAENGNTGASSDNIAKVNVNNQLTVHNSNSANTTNLVEAEVNSGNNAAEGNTGHGMILTGSASLGLNFITMSNANFVGSQRFYANWQNIYDNHTGDIDISTEAAVSASPLSGLLIDASNSDTGAGSNNQAIVDVNDQTSIINQNTGKIRNEISAKVTTGKNKASKNTGTGSIATGQANSSVNVMNFLNSNIVSSNWWLKTLNVFGSWKGNMVLPMMPRPNLTVTQPELEASANATGAGSENAAEANINTSVAIANTNNAVITNSVDIKTNSGDNKTSFNGGTGIVKFGDADAETNELNVANVNVTGDSWWMVVVNKFGKWLGTTIGSPVETTVSATAATTVLTPNGSGIRVNNNSTGPESNNFAGANVTHSTEITNANEADIMNKLKIEAITGENETQFNSGHGYIEAGSIDAVNNLVNFANANVNVGNWLVTVINVFGDWEGNVVFRTATQSEIDAINSNSQLMVNGGSSSNAGTGAGSSNSSGSSSSSTGTTSNTNASDTANNTSASTLTGENSASYNTGSGIVTAGGADSNTTIQNQVNTNVTGASSGGGNATSTNSGTGAGSNNSAVTNNSTDTNVANSNTAQVTNSVQASNNTGQNSANYNTGNGAVDTGWATTFAGLYNQVNENQTNAGQLLSDLNSITDTTGNDIGSQTQGNGSGNQNSDTTPSGGGSSAGSTSSGGAGGGQPALTQTTAPSGQQTVQSAYYPPAPVTYGQGRTVDSASAEDAKNDLNSDGYINDLDFSILMANWKKPVHSLKADINSDGSVDESDLRILLARWY